MTPDLEGLPLFTQKKPLTYNATLVWAVMAPSDGRTFGDYWSQEAVVDAVNERFGVVMNTHALNARLSELRQFGYQVDKKRAPTGKAYWYRVSSRPAEGRAA